MGNVPRSRLGTVPTRSSGGAGGFPLAKNLENFAGFGRETLQRGGEGEGRLRKWSDTDAKERLREKRFGLAAG